MKVGIIGCGRWGTFIGWYLNKIGKDVAIYGRKTSKKMNELVKERKNDVLTLSDRIKLTYHHFDRLAASSRAYARTQRI